MTTLETPVPELTTLEEQLKHVCLLEDMFKYFSPTIHFVEVPCTETLNTQVIYDPL